MYPQVPLIISFGIKIVLCLTECNYSDYIHKEIYDPIVNAVGKLLTEQINTVIAAGENAKVILRSLFPMQYNVFKANKNLVEGNSFDRWPGVLTASVPGVAKHNISGHDKT